MVTYDGFACNQASGLWRSRGYNRSMAAAPRGAVTRMANTATVSTVCPQARPMESGIALMAAWTVAFGR